VAGKSVNCTARRIRLNDEVAGTERDANRCRATLWLEGEEIPARHQWRTNEYGQRGIELVRSQFIPRIANLLAAIAVPLERTAEAFLEHDTLPKNP
jgi:hypothetical protein